jgi:hypothetical protein
LIQDSKRESEYVVAAALARLRFYYPEADQRWLWKGRHVSMFDGTTVTLPDAQ